MGSLPQDIRVSGSLTEMIYFVLFLLPFSGAVNVTTGCGDGKVRGVNLGGWLLLEPWITPVFFEEVNIGDNFDKIVDEWTHAELLDRETYLQRMVTHWDTFVNEEDFAKLAAAGVSHVRIPVSYWYWQVDPSEPFPPVNSDLEDPTNALFYLLRALGWMEKYGLKASMDLHTGPGSQNGYDNSGRRGPIHWVDDSYPGDRHNIDRTLTVIDLMCEGLSSWIEQGLISQSTLYGIGILNEPHICGPWHNGGKYQPVCLEDFYPKAYDVVRKHFSAQDVKVVVDIAALGFNAFDNVLPEHRGDVDIDAHHYQCFGAANNWAEHPDGWTKHLTEACRFGSDIASSPIQTWGGEFSLAVTDCQKYLQGGYVTPYNPQSSDQTCRYYNSDFSTFAPEYKEFLKDYFLAQLDSFENGEKGLGWTMWTMKTEANCAPEWDFLFLLENGIIPADLCNRETYC